MDNHSSFSIDGNSETFYQLFFSERKVVEAETMSDDDDDDDDLYEEDEDAMLAD